MMTTLAISGYRSLRDIRLSLERINIVTGPNGSGKSNLFKALKLLTEVARGELFSSLAREGGFPSVLWAGPDSFSRSVKRGEHAVQGLVRKDAVALKLGFASDSYSYLIELGHPVPTETAFNFDPEIKQEALWHGEVYRPSTLIAKRRGGLLSIRDDNAGGWRTAQTSLASFDSMMTHGVDPHLAPEILVVRDLMRNWRFYDHFRTDDYAPARSGHIGTRTPILSTDGHDLAAAIQTIIEIGDNDALDVAIDDAFPGSRLEVVMNDDGRFNLFMHQHGLLRELSTRELSDGTLRYILLVAVLLSPRPAQFLVLNEPETSLHPSLLAPLARLIVQASTSSQILLVSHSQALIDCLNAEVDCQLIELEKSFSETLIPEDCQARWTWPNKR